VGKSGKKWKARERSMFMGEYQYSIDHKGRLVIPIKLREAKAIRKFVLTRGLDNCLFLYPLDEWKILEEKVESLPMTKGEARLFTRLLASGAVESSIDKQGRISIPANLREYAGMNNEAHTDVVIIGALNRIEIWARAKWEEYVKESEKSFEAIAERLVDLGV
jgi:MraZ protein